MNQLDEDTAFVRRLLAPHDPLPAGPSAEDVAAVRARVQPPRRRAPRLVAAAVGLLLVAANVVPLIRPPAAWAIQHSDDLGIGVRVELPEFFQRGPDSDDVVTALRDHGVAVTLRYNRDLTPWKTGRIAGLSTDYGDLPQHLFEELSEAMAPGGRETIDVDLTEIGIKHHRDGGVTVFPEKFTGRVEIVVAVAPWQAEPDPQTWP